MNLFICSFIGGNFGLDPDTDSYSGSGSADPIESGSETWTKAVPISQEKDGRGARYLYGDFVTIVSGADLLGLALNVG